MEFKNVLLELKDQIATITLNRPDALNALNQETLQELSVVFSDHIPASIRAVLLTGAGKAFVAGADIKQMQSYAPEEAGKFATMGQNIFNQIEAHPCPVIAVINGFALGGGCELAMACDIRVASSKAKFGQPEVKLGLIPGFGGTQRLTRLVGAGKAKQLVFSGEMIKAEEAHRIGLVDEVCAPEELMSKAMALAASIAAQSPVAVRLSKQAINMGSNMDLKRALELEAHLFAQSFASKDSTEGIGAFVEKREAKFTGK